MSQTVALIAIYGQPSDMNNEIALGFKKEFKKRHLSVHIVSCLELVRQVFIRRFSISEEMMNDISKVLDIHLCTPSSKCIDDFWMQQIMDHAPAGFDVIILSDGVYPITRHPQWMSVYTVLKPSDPGWGRASGCDLRYPQCEDADEQEEWIEAQVREICCEVMFGDD